jgi:hypothetical protein
MGDERNNNNKRKRTLPTGALTTTSMDDLTALSNRISQNIAKLTDLAFSDCIGCSRWASFIVRR